MRVIARKTLITFYLKHADAKTALEEWFTKTTTSEWLCFSDIKKTFNSVDAIGDKRFVFNIRGNKYRVVTIILFQPKVVFIRFIGTHEEYDRTDCLNI